MELQMDYKFSMVVPETIDFSQDVFERLRRVDANHNNGLFFKGYRPFVAEDYSCSGTLEISCNPNDESHLRSAILNYISRKK